MDTVNKSATVTGDEISPKLLKSLQIIADTEGYTSYDIDVKLQSTNGGSFIGVLHEVNVKNTSQDEKEINIFVKSLTSSAESIYDIPRSFEKEAYFYNELNNVFNKIQEEYNVPMEDRYYAARGYGKSNSEHIIMENLAKRGYGMINRLEVAPLKFTEKSMEQLAKYHALSFVIQEKKPDYLVEKIKTLEQPFYYNTESFNSFINNVSMLASKCLDPIGKEKLRKFIPTSFPKYKHYAEDPASVRCLCHGDYRPNNIMVKYENGEIKDLIPIDYQIMFYGCPIIDFLYYIFSSTDQEFRKNHLDEIKDVYHNTITNFLKYFNMDVDKYFSRKEFEKVYKERLDYGLMFTFWCLPITLADEGQIPDVTQTSLADLQFNPSETVRSRLQGIVDDFIQWGYL